MMFFCTVLKPKAANKYFYNLSFAIDQLGNVLCSHVFNLILLKKNPAKEYGNPDETISHVTGVNYLTGTLTPLGKFLALVLNKLDKNHVQNAAENEQ